MELTDDQIEYINAKMVILEYQSKHPESVTLPPPFVKIKDHGSELRLDTDDNSYYRYAGAWSIKYIFDGYRFFTYCPHIPDLHNLELIEITYQEWRKGNEGYV